MEFRWQDEFGLAGKEPFLLSINGRDDEAPSMSCEDLPRQKVVLDSETLQFKVKAQDDFGVKRIGMEWQGVESAVVKTPAKGERILAAGGNDKESLEIAGTFSAKSLGIEPQPVQVRIFAEDYFPGRARVYSPTYMFYVLERRAARDLAHRAAQQMAPPVAGSARPRAAALRDQQAVASPCARGARPARGPAADREPGGRRTDQRPPAVEPGRRPAKTWSSRPCATPSSASAISRNGPRCSRSSRTSRPTGCPRWPTCSSRRPRLRWRPATPSATRRRWPAMVRDTRAGSRPAEPPDAKKAPAAVPQVVDRESSQQPPDKNAGQPAAAKTASQPRWRLPETTLAGKNGDGKQACPTGQKVDEAVAKQQDLLAEFEKIADELNRVLANLEGSTLVKRLKAASRMQYSIAGRISDQVRDAFGLSAARAADGAAKVIGELAEQEAKGSHDVSLIMDDMQSYFERRRFMQFKTVLDEMRKHDVVGSLRQLGDDLKKENGLSIAQCEFWSDTLDRWAEDLVDPACWQAPARPSRAAVCRPRSCWKCLQILEGEVNLREETRVAEQARPALAAEDYGRQAGKLSKSQDGLKERVDKVTERIRPVARWRERVRL